MLLLLNNHVKGKKVLRHIAKLLFARLHQATILFNYFSNSNGYWYSNFIHEETESQKLSDLCQVPQGESKKFRVKTYIFWCIVSGFSLPIAAAGLAKVAPEWIHAWAHLWNSLNSPSLSFDTATDTDHGQQNSMLKC